MAINLNSSATINLNVPNLSQLTNSIRQMQSSLNTMPGQWQRMNAASLTAMHNMQMATQAMMQNTTVATTRLNTFSSTLAKTSHQMRTGLIQPMMSFLGRMGASGAAGARGAGGWAAGMGSHMMGPSYFGRGGGGGGGGGGTFGSGRFYARGAGLFGSIPFLRNLGVGTTIAGLAGGGSLYGLNALSGSASEARRFYQGIGSDYGFTKSFPLAYNKTFNAKSFMEAIAMGQMQPSSDAAAAMWTVGTNPQKGTLNEAANRTLMKIRQDTRGMDPFTLGNYYSGNRISGLNMSEYDLRRIADATDSEFNDQFKKQLADQMDLNTPDSTVKNWQDLNIQLKTTAQVLEKQFMVGLEKLTGPLTELSKAVSEATKELTSSPGFKRSVSEFAFELHNLALILNPQTRNTIVKDKLEAKLKKEGDAVSRLWHNIGGDQIWNAASGWFKSTENRAAPRDFMSPIIGDKRSSWLGTLFSAVRGWFSSTENRPYTNPFGGIGSSIGGIGNSIMGGIQGAVGAMTSPLFSGGGGGASLAGTGIGLENLTEDDKAVLRTLAGLEAGPAGYKSIGKDVVDKFGNVDRAYGMYQIMGKNIGPWTKNHFGTSSSISDFVNNPLLQDRLALAQFNSYRQQYGNTLDALSSWKSGGPWTGKDISDPAAGDTLRGYLQKGAGIWNSQPGVTKVEFVLQNQTGSAINQNAAAGTGQGITVTRTNN